MTPREVRKLLIDIQQACDLLVRFTDGKAYEDYLADPLLRSGVERQFEIVGEALRQLELRDPAMAARFTDIRRIVAFRNRLIHGYATVSDAVVWGVIGSNLPRLVAEVQHLLREAEKS